MDNDKTFKNIMDDDFARIILKIRKEKHLTQKELAELINVSDRTISKWENGQSVPDLICIKNICKSLGISPSSLVLDKKSKKEKLSTIYKKIGKFLTIKKIINIFIFIVLIVLLLFYLNNRDTVTIYKLKLASDDIYIRDGYIINTKYKNIIVINDLKLNRDNDYDSINVELYTIVNGDKIVIYSKNTLENIYVDEFNEYNQYKINNIVDSLSQEMHINIETNTDDIKHVYDEKLSIVEKYHNNSIVKRKIQNESETSQLATKNIDINDSLIKVGYEYDKENLNYYIIKNNKQILISLYDNYITLYDKDSIKCSYYYLKGIISYIEYDSKSNKTIELKMQRDNNNINCIYGNCNSSYPIIDEIFSVYEEIKDIL